MSATKQPQKRAEKATTAPDAPPAGDNTQTPENVPQKASIAALVQPDAQGILKGSNLEQEWKLAEMMVKSGMLPKQYDTPAKVITAKQFAIELGVPPLTALRQIAVINGRPQLYGDLPLGLVRRSGLLDSMKEYFLDDKGQEVCQENKNLTAEVEGAVCVIKRKNEAGREFFWTSKDDQLAGISGYETHKKYKRTMYMYRARSMALKSVFSDVLNGVAICEYDSNTLPIDDAGCPVASTAEVKQDIEESMTPEKREKIHAITEQIKSLQKDDPRCTDARIVQIMNEEMGSTDPMHASWAQLESLHRRIDKMLEAVNV